MVKVGVVIGGCGHQDGSEIHESVIAMLSLEEAGAEVMCLSIDKPQAKVINHVERKPVSETRNLMVEASRMARGKIRSVRTVGPTELDALVIPGGFGVAMNFCNFAEKGPAMTVDKDLESLLRAMHEAGKPIGAICIAPVILAKVFGSVKVRLTVGNDAETAAKIKEMGAIHVDCRVSDCVIDEKNLLVTTPAYMLAKGIKELHSGIRKLAIEVVKLASR